MSATARLPRGLDYMMAQQAKPVSPESCSCTCRLDRFRARVDRSPFSLPLLGPEFGAAGAVKSARFYDYGDEKYRRPPCVRPPISPPFLNRSF